MLKLSLLLSVFASPLPHQQDHKHCHLKKKKTPQTSKLSLSAVLCFAVWKKGENDRRHSVGNLVFEIIDERLHFSKSKQKKVIKRENKHLFCSISCC